MRQSEKLAEQAAEAFNSGNPHEAARLFNDVLRLDPKHKGALNFLSHYAVQSGQFDAAVKILAQFIQVEPSNSDARRMMGEALEMKGELVHAERMYRDALMADPTNSMAAVYLAILLAKQGKTDKAAGIVSLAFQANPTFFDEHAFNPVVFPAAAQRIRDADALLRAVLAEQHHKATASSELISNAVWPQVTPSVFSYNLPNQEPWLFFVPGLTPAEPVHPVESVPSAQALENAAADIAAEIARTIDPEADGEPGVPGLPPATAGSLFRSVFIYRNGQRQPSADTLPVTTSVIDSLSLARVGEGPADVRLLILAPGAERPLYSGQSNAHLTVHLPLTVAEGEAGIEIDGTLHAWQAGKALVFDDSFQHRLVNRTEAPCVVLMTQVYHPALSSADIEAMEASFEARRQWLANRSFD